MMNSSFLDYRMPTSLDLPMIDTAIVRGKPGQPVGRGVRLAPAFEEQTGTVKSRVMGTAKKLLGG
ncbi:MAG: hypothetical protein COB69_07825 [Phycisphaera sp.]|nr:MAG: hypothetical protein COB69_07825 [Phycisphaera sp.]